jgi:hypothetical protein
VAGWINSTFPGTNPDSPRRSIRALEEMVELCLVSGATQNEIECAVQRALLTGLGDDQDEDEGIFRPAAIPAEAADVLIVLYGVAGMRGFDLHAEVDRKMAINRGRQWTDRGDGTGYHVASGPDTRGAT